MNRKLAAIAIALSLVACQWPTTSPRTQLRVAVDSCACTYTPPTRSCRAYTHDSRIIPVRECVDSITIVIY